MMFYHALVVCVTVVLHAAALDNGLAKLPPLGWMSGQRFECNIDCVSYPDDCLSEKLIKSTADVMVSGGYVKAGYEYMLIGDCWMNKTRDEQGKLQPDPKRFPSGMKSLADYVHQKGLKLGLYLCAGNLTCQGYPGSRDHFQDDAQSLAGWGIDMVRLDGCNIEKTKDMDQLYPQMGQYLNETGRQMLYFCDWPFFQRSHGIQPNYDLISKTCNIFSPYQDMQDSWTSLDNTIKWYVDNAHPLVNFSRPGSWNFPDQLLVGDYGMSMNQQEMQMAVWSIMASTMLVSADLRKIPEKSRDLLLNYKALSITRDALGVMGTQRSLKGQVHIWTKPILPKGSWALALHYNNISGGPTKVSVKVSDLGLVTAAAYNFTDVFSGKFIGEYKPWHTFNCEVEPTGVLFVECLALP